MKAEMSDIWTCIRGKEGDVMREKVGVIREVVKTSFEKGGARACLDALGRLILS